MTGLKFNNRTEVLKIIITIIITVILDCKTVGFFSKSVKKSVKRGVRVLRACEAREKKPYF